MGYSIITDDNKWCLGGYREYVSGGGHLNACPGGLECIIEACPGGEGNNIEACPGGIYKTVPGRWRYNISLSRTAGVLLHIGTFAIIVICRGVRLNNGIAQMYTPLLAIDVNQSKNESGTECIIQCVWVIGVYT